ncbi:hypothetical protein OUZ56_010807 [Daphnia magna]|uniref:Uncharacterized protein n=1 Tax=Daphnia magna TaxID=35525 RepID=A0ABQ9YYK3_9CRUS|nr:hypothetical protein OUZ56_010807 [Daphnia magna]
MYMYFALPYVTFCGFFLPILSTLLLHRLFLASSQHIRHTRIASIHVGALAYIIIISESVRRVQEARGRDDALHHLVGGE